MQKNKISSDSIISISAIVIAILSIIITVWQGIETRKHNRLSVQPRLDISYSLDFQDSLAQITIKNNGLGPAVIDNAKAILNEKEYNIGEINDYLKFQNRLGLKEIPTTYNILRQGSTIIANESKQILMVKLKYLKKLQLNPMSLINDISIIIKYKSLYEEEFITKLAN